MMTMPELLKRIDRYKAATGFADSTIGGKIWNDWGRLKYYRDGGGMTVRTLQLTLDRLAVLEAKLEEEKSS